MPRFRTAYPASTPYTHPEHSAHKLGMSSNSAMEQKLQDELISLGYNQIQASFININPRAAKAVIKYHLYLMECGFTHDEITEIANAHNGFNNTHNGFKNICAIFVYYELLRERGLNNADIVREVLKTLGHIQLFSFITVSVLGPEKSLPYLLGRGINLVDQQQLHDVLWEAWSNRAVRIRPLIQTSEPFEETAEPETAEPETAMPEEVEMLEEGLVHFQPSGTDTDVSNFEFTYTPLSGASQPVAQVGENEWAQELALLNIFTQEQIDSLLSKKSFNKNTLSALKRYARAIMYSYGFSVKQILQIVSHAGGSNNLKAVQACFHELLELKFTAEQIVRMVSHIGGSNNLEAVQACFHELLELEFTAEQIVNMVSHVGGSKNLKAVQECFKVLRALEFTAEQIVNMVSHGGASGILYTLCKWFYVIVNELGEEAFLLNSRNKAVYLVKRIRELRKGVLQEAPLPVNNVTSAPLLPQDEEENVWLLNALEREVSASSHLLEEPVPEQAAMPEGPFHLNPLPERELDVSNLGLTYNAASGINQPIAEVGKNEWAQELESLTIFTHQQIASLLSKNSFNKNTLSALKRYAREIMYSYGFSAEQIVKIVGHKGGSKNLEAVQECFEDLNRLGFSVEQIVRIVSRNGGSNNLEAVQECFHELQELGFTAKQIVRMGSHNGGSNNLKAVKACFKVLRDLKFSAEQIVRMVSHDGGSNNLEAVQKCFDVLRKLEFTAEQIVRMVSHIGGSKNLMAVQECFHELQELEFTAEQIVSMVSHTGGSNNLEAVKACFDDLKRLRFSAEQIVRMVSCNGGSNNLEAVQECFHELQELEFTAEQIVRIVSHVGGSKNLKAVQECFKVLRALEFTAEQIVNMVSHGGASGILYTLCKWFYVIVNELGEEAFLLNSRNKAVYLVKRIRELRKGVLQEAPLPVNNLTPVPPLPQEEQDNDWLLTALDEVSASEVLSYMGIEVAYEPSMNLGGASRPG